MSVGGKTYRNTAYYCDCFSKINVYKNKKRGGAALNQPILLLSVIDLIAQGFIKDNSIEITDELIDTFKKYWSFLSSDEFQNSDFVYPFFHLKNHEGKFWRLQFNEKSERDRPQTINVLKKVVDYAYLENELFALLHDQNSRKVLIDALITIWFSASQKKIEEILLINQDFQDSTNKEESIELYQPNISRKFYLKKSMVREAFFRKAIVQLYDYKCAFCRLKVTSSISQSIVDGAHIKPFAQFYDSSINNGISFCKNHHWAFDQGWFGIDNKYKIIIASDLQEESPHARTMKDFEGEVILLPNLENHFPRIEFLEWHRQNVFRM